MNHFRWSVFFGMAMAAGVGLLAGCAGSHARSGNDAVGMANPASRYCVEKGGRLVVQEDAAGNQVGMCHLPDGSVIEEWTLFRRDHPRPVSQ